MHIGMQNIKVLKLQKITHIVYKPIHFREIK